MHFSSWGKGQWSSNYVINFSHSENCTGFVVVIFYSRTAFCVFWWFQKSIRVALPLNFLQRKPETHFKIQAYLKHPINVYRDLREFWWTVMKYLRWSIWVLNSFQVGQNWRHRKVDQKNCGISKETKELLIRLTFLRRLQNFPTNYQ